MNKEEELWNRLSLDYTSVYAGIILYFDKYKIDMNDIKYITVKHNDTICEISKDDFIEASKNVMLCHISPHITLVGESFYIKSSSSEILVRYDIPVRPTSEVSLAKELLIGGETKDVYTKIGVRFDYSNDTDDLDDFERMLMAEIE